MDENEEKARSVLLALREVCQSFNVSLWACACCDAINIYNGERKPERTLIAGFVEVGPRGFKGTVENEGHGYISEGEGYGIDD